MYGNDALVTHSIYGQLLGLAVVGVEKLLIQELEKQLSEED